MAANLAIDSGLTRIAADTAGRGAPVVFLHAGVADRRMWGAQLPAVADLGFLAVAYDRRGFGETLHADERYSQVGDLCAVLDAVAPREPAVLVGCSQGGRIAVDAALAVPHRVRALVLVAPAVGGAPEVTDFPPAIRRWIERMEAADAAADVDAVNALEAHAWLDGPLSAENRVSGHPRDLFLEMNELALRAELRGTEDAPPPAYARLPEIVAPALVVWGDLDFPNIGAACEHLAAALPRARALRLPNVAHLPSLEAPAAFNAALLDFLRNL
ncbi:MAG TPA: alpha/beta hydrolase [Casimicrobiaceae bacterium]|nr:alpha/beta hydrolase [Casimicrobiaceae bacterium]